ncbi:MAG: MFS transporter [Kiritimatiellae bacterium]|nr:MFS transporter [Kiritimatiellia bacterium]
MTFFKKLPPSETKLLDKAEIDRRYRFRRWTLVPTITLGYSLYYVCRLAFSATKKSLIDSGTYSSVEVGWIGSAMLIAYAAGKLFNGFLADHANIRRFFSFALLVSSIANFLVGLHLPAMMLVGVWGVNGYFQAAGAPNCVVGITRWFPSKTRGTWYGVWSASHGIGEALGYIITAFVIVSFGWMWGFRCAALFGLFGVVIAYLFMRDSPESEGLPSVAEYEGSRTATSNAQKSVGGAQWSVLKNWAVWMIALAALFAYMSRYAIIDWGMYFMQEKKGYEVTDAAYIIGINSIVGGIASILCGWITDKFFGSRRNVVALVCGILNVVALSLFMFSPGRNPVIDTVAMVLFGIAIGVLLTYFGGLMAVDLVPKAAAGAALGVCGMASYVGAALQSFVSGYLIRAKDDPLSQVNRFYDVTVNAFGRSFTFDWIALFWIGAAVLSIVCALTVWNARAEEE